MSPSKIFLTGLPGSGKTTLGKEIAGSLAVSFIDLDAEIEKSEGMNVAAIFEKKGEEHFRQIESKLLKQWCSSTEPFVMATGGGAPCHGDNMETINRSGTSVFLDVPPKEIARRISGATISKRPMFTKTGFDAITEQIEFMRSNRVTYYRQAKITMVGGATTARQILAKLKTGTQP